MFVLCIMFLVVSPDLGYSIPNGRKVVGPRSSTGSCLSRGGLCMAPGSVRSFPGGTTTRCLGPQGCPKGLLCCMKGELEKKHRKGTRKSTPRKKDKPRQDSPARPVQCPPSARCGVSDPLNGGKKGRCRKNCKPIEGEKDSLGECPKAVCKCCFRRRKCKTLRSCTKKGGTCRDFCDPGEKKLDKGCKNNCFCCVKDGVDPPAPDQCVACDAQAGSGTKACKKKCDESWGEREFPEYITSGTKKCCLRDCLHWQHTYEGKEENLWYKHGESFYHDCDYGYCKNGVIKTPGKRDPTCCTVEGMATHQFYYQNNKTFCAEIDDVEKSYYCNNGTAIELDEIVPGCEEHLVRGYESILITDGKVVAIEPKKEIESSKENEKKSPKENEKETNS